MVNYANRCLPAGFLRILRGLGLLLALWTFPAFCTSRAGTGFSGRIVLTLDDAASFPEVEGQKSETRPIDLFVECQKGKWTDVWGQSQKFSRALYEGFDTNGEVTDNSVRIKTTMLVPDGPWYRGGVGHYEIELTRKPASGLRFCREELEGRFRGSFHSLTGPVVVEGRASGVVLPLNNVEVDFVPVKPGEHPRLLFREKDLRRIRARMESPLGKALMERMSSSENAIALGLMYQLTGNGDFAERAAEAARKKMAETGGGAFAIGRIWGYRLADVAYAYDLCYDAWNSELRRKAEAYMDDMGWRCLYRPNTLGPVNMQPGSNYVVVMYGGAGLAAMALMGEKGPCTDPPRDPGTEPIVVPETGGFDPPADIPIVDFEEAVMPQDWLIVGPWDTPKDKDIDCLAGFSPPAKAHERIRKGSEVSYNGRSSNFRPLEKDHYWTHERWTKNLVSIELTTAFMPQGGKSTDAFNRTGYLYTILRNDKERLLQCHSSRLGGTVDAWISGRHVRNEDYVRLAPGLHPYLMRVRSGETNPWGKLWIIPRFTSVTLTEAQTNLRTRSKMFELAHRRWQEDRRQWEYNGQNVRWNRMARYAQRLDYLNFQRGVGNGGFQGEGEGYTLECHHVPHDYGLAHRNAYGRTVTGLPDISHQAARYVVTTIFGQGRSTSGERGSKLPVVHNQTYGRGGGTIDTKYLCRAIELCPEQWKPAVLWFWLRRLGVTAEEMQTEQGIERALGSGQFDDPMILVHTFLNYPLDLNPVDPEEVMPRVWQAQTRGFYAFRNGWKGPEDIVAQIYAKDGPSCGWNQAEAGCFQIFGLGYPWAWKINDAQGKVGTRWLDNVLMLPEDPINCNARCTPSFFQANEKTGSGVVTIDMNNLYECMRMEKDYRGKDTRVAYDGGITGLRSFAADYSGKSGAPALFAVVDKVVGGGRKIWVFQLPKDSGRDSSQASQDVVVEDNSFILTTNSQTSFKATFILPADVKIERPIPPYKAHPLSKIEEGKTPALHVTSPDGRSGDFFVVMTLQKGSAPGIEVEGEGLDSVVTVGKQTVEFDGRKFIVGD